MHSPYTPHQLDALMAAQASVGLTVTALLWARPVRPRIATGLLLAATWVAVLSPVDQEFLTGIGFTMGPAHFKHALRLSAVLAGVGALLSRRVLLAVLGVLGAVGLWVVRNYITDSDWDVAGANLAFVGLLVGAHYRSSRSERELGAIEPFSRFLPGAFARDDLMLFALATSLAAIVATVVMSRHTNSGDEWANTYQAALFMKGRAYETVPTCADAFRSYWVYQYKGRSFAQYTPGWPLFMAPFVALRAVWLAAPATLGVLAVGVARVSRRAAAGFSAGTAGPSGKEIRAAGWFGALTVMLGSTMLLNAGSRYPHVFVAAMFVWSVEALLSIASRLRPDEPPGARETDTVRPGRDGWLKGALLGTTAALMIAARPADGLTLGVGLFAYFVVALARRRLGLWAVVSAAVAFVAWGVLSLVILHAQVGQWFKTGYSITELYYPWNKLTFSAPKPDEIRAGFPLASGSYCWWPCAPAIGLAGLASLRGRARRIAFVMFASFVPFFTFYTLFDIGRHGDFGYGPRYEFPCVVPMAIGAGVLMARLWAQASRRILAKSALSMGGPLALALTAGIIGLVRIAPLVYPGATSEIHDHNLLQEAIVKAKLHNTVIIAKDGISNVDSMDLTEDLPLQFYPDQDVLIARSASDASNDCVRKEFAHRTILIAEKVKDEVRLRPDTPGK